MGVFLKSLFEAAKPEVADRLKYLSPAATLVLADIAMWAMQNELPFVITEAVTTEAEDIALKRKSDSHRTCRAFDISLRGWPMEKAHELKRTFDFKYRQIAAIRADGTPNLIVIHDAGTGMHIHGQVHRRFASPNPILGGVKLA
jgi:hypothetical protein